MQDYITYAVALTVAVIIYAVIYYGKKQAPSEWSSTSGRLSVPRTTALLLAALCLAPVGLLVYMLGGSSVKEALIFIALPSLYCAWCSINASKIERDIIWDHQGISGPSHFYLHPSAASRTFLPWNEVDYFYRHPGKETVYIGSYAGKNIKASSLYASAHLLSEVITQNAPHAKIGVRAYRKGKKIWNDPSIPSS